MVPILKRGRRVKVKEYRWVTITQYKAYKVYAAVLAERLREEMKSRVLLSPSKAGFRKGMSTIDHIHVLNYLINKKVAEEKGKMIISFLDMKAVFDSVDRETLTESIEREV